MTPSSGAEEFSKEELRDLYLLRSDIQLNKTAPECLTTYLTSVCRAEKYNPDIKTVDQNFVGAPVKKPSIPLGHVQEAPNLNSTSHVLKDWQMKTDERGMRTAGEGTVCPDPAQQLVGKKYKPVHLKVKPTLAELPDKFRIVRDIKGDPLATLPELSLHPPPFVPTGRYTEERMKEFEKVHDEGNFLNPPEMAIIHDFMCKHNDGFAWHDSERGSFKEEFFPPVEIPVVPHTPWTERNIRIPPGIYEEVCGIIKTKIDAGVYERSNSSYRSRWFTVIKKGPAKKLRIVHSLEPLNAVTIAHSGLPPATEEIAEHFAGRACGGMMDLYVGYDERPLAETSRDLTTFQTPFGALRLVTLPMGWTNSVPIFHDDVTYILQDEVPHVTIPYIDDVPVRGPETRYELTDGTEEEVPGAPGVRRFFWEHMQNVNRVVQRMKYSGGTFSGYKSVLCASEITVVGHRCTYEGRRPSTDRIGVVERWGPCKDVSDVRAFMGTIGVCRNFIKDFAKIGQPIQKLTRTAEPWEWGPEQDKAQRMLVELLKASPALKPIDYRWTTPVVLAVDTSYKAVGYYIYQEDPEIPGRKHFARFDSITLNEREARFSQPKRELFGLMRCLDACYYWFIGVRNLLVETDAKYIKGMLTNPSLGPNATVNRWIDRILMFHFTLVHKPGKGFGPDGLSRRDLHPGDPTYPDPDDGYDEPSGPLKFVNSSPGVDDPLEFEDFKTEIDTRGGFYFELAKDITDFDTECQEARTKEVNFLSEVKANLGTGRFEPEREEYFAQLVQTAIIPDLEFKYDPSKREPYDESKRTHTAKAQDDNLPLIKIWLKDHARPKGLDDKEYAKFARQASNFFLDKEGRLYRRGIDGAHKLVVDKDHRMYMMRAGHDSLGHRGFFATKELLGTRFWWPEMERDISWYIKSCHLCQIRERTLLSIPPTITHTPSIFQVLHADTLHMSPPSNGHKFIVQGRCALSSWMEGAPLKVEDGRSLGTWLFQDIICRWGSLKEIVTDNGSAFRAATAWLESKYGIRGITISAYNSKANGIAERAHWDVRQSLFKATGGDNKKWFYFFHHVMWADRITIRKGTGCSPYFMITGAHPTLPLDIIEATWLVKLPDRTLSTSEIIGYRAQALAKHVQHVGDMRARVDLEKRKRLLKYEENHAATIKDYNFKPGSLVLIRNTEIEKSLNKKMKARYLGPMIVLRRNRGGAYIVCEMDGSVWQHKVGAFRVIPYFARRSIKLPSNLQELIDISKDTLNALVDSKDTGTSEITKDRDYTFDGIHLKEPDESSDSEVEETGSETDESSNAEEGDVPRQSRSQRNM